MMNDSLNAQIRQRIDAFLEELAALVRASALASVEQALGEGAASAPRRGPGRPRGSGRRGVGRPSAASSGGGRRIRRSSEDLKALAGQIEGYVKAHPGQRLEEIGTGLKTDTAILKRPIANLLATKALRTTGQKRGTRYFAGGRGRSAAKPSRSRRPRKSRKAARKRTAKRAAKAAPKASPPAST